MYTASRLPTITLIFALLALLPLLAPVAAQHNVASSRRGHTRMIRMYGPPAALVRKAGPLDALGIGSSSNAPGGSSTAPAGASSSPPASSPDPKSGVTSPGSPTSSSPTAGSSPTPPPDGGLGGVVGGIGGILGGGTSSSDSSTTNSTSVTSPTSTAPTNTVTKTAASVTDVGAISPSSPSASSTETQTSTTSIVNSGPPTPLSEAQKHKEDTQTRFSHKTITILGVVAGVVGSAGLIWTIVRKWKFRPSRNFEDRLAPIDWQPTPGGADMGERHRYSIGGGSQASGMDAASMRRNMFAPDHVSVAPDFPPAHDFTAVSGVQRGPSGGRGAYGGY